MKRKRKKNRKLSKAAAKAKRRKQVVTISERKIAARLQASQSPLANLNAKELAATFIELSCLNSNHPLVKGVTAKFKKAIQQKKEVTS